MARTVLYQYARADRAAILRVTSFFDNETAQALAGVIPYSQTPDAGLIGIFGGKNGWKSIKVGVELSIAPESFAELLPDPASARTTTAAMVTVSSAKTKYRRGEKLKWQRDGTWAGAIELRREDVEAEVLLSPTIVRTKAENSSAGYGCFEGAILAAGDDVTLALKEPRPPLSGDLDYKWVDFRESEVPWLRRRGDDVFYLSPHIKPVMYLNIRWPGLQRVLEHKAVTGVNAALRRSFRSTIGQAGWLQLLITAIGTIKETGEGEYEVIGAPWAAPIAKWAAAKLHPDLSGKEQLKAVYTAFHDPVEIGSIVAQLQSLAHERTKVGRDLDAASKAMDNNEPPAEDETT